MKKNRRSRGTAVLAGLAAAMLTAAVLSAPAQATVSAAGAGARGQAALLAAQADLNASARVPGTAWAVDPARNQVVVSVDSSVDAAGLAKVRAVAARSGGAVAVERVAGRFALTVQGGDPVHTGGADAREAGRVQRVGRAFDDIAVDRHG